MDNKEKQRVEISLKSYVIITVIVCLITMIPLSSTRKSLYRSWMKNKIQDTKITELNDEIQSLKNEIKSLKNDKQIIEK